MRIQNIDRVLVFQANGATLTPKDIAARYKIDVIGTNFYYGINDENVKHFAKTGNVLQQKHETYFEAMLNQLAASAEDEFAVVLGLEPPGRTKAYQYDFVSGNLALVRELATRLDEFQQQALDRQKRLLIWVRYASEMNDGSNADEYKKTFGEVREVFKEAAPNVPFSFSPAIRADVDEGRISEYWPGDDVVDTIAGTWYIHGDEQRLKSTANFKSYVLHRVATGKPFGVDEIGGANQDFSNNDDTLLYMLHQIEALQAQNVSFKYGTLFLASDKWGKQATLAFLRGAHAPVNVA